MSLNSNESPSTDSQKVGAQIDQRKRLRSIAKYQRRILVCLLMYLIAHVLLLVVPSEYQIFVLAGGGLFVLIGSFSVLVLSVKLFGVVQSILFAVLALIPCIGLLVLLVVNGRATVVLRENGIQVGLMGAKLSEL